MRSNEGWINVEPDDAGSTLIQHWVNTLCLVDVGVCHICILHIYDS